MNLTGLNEFQEKSKRTLPASGTWEEREQALINYSFGLVGESGETIDHIKKTIFHGHILDVGEIRNELGDVLHYVAGLATLCGLSLEDIASANVEKLARRYPEGFSSDASIARVDAK